MLGLLNKYEIEEVLANHYVGHLGCHADGVTYVVPVSYAYHDNCVYGHTEEGKKIWMMRKNPGVCFQVEDMQDMANWKSVIAWGKYEELTEPELRSQALVKLMDRRLPYVASRTARLSPDWPFSPGDLNKIKGIVYRITLEEKTGRFEKVEGPSFFL
ncbi:MAG: pyridoxamine 5'-phosphate oxidase family protein [Chitinophagaceae bacterium]|nr:pyridoxamine 5'-phosphate oxidase family protein [Chitinophagaceae bacterium]